MDFCEIRKELIKKEFARMNDKQFEAVTTVNGPVLVLAGAGSGKTTVLVNRVLNLVKYGNAYNSESVSEHSSSDIQNALDYLDGKTDYIDAGIWSVDAPKPWEILAITFTNKAASELKNRIADRLGDSALDIWAGTFHSVCGKILRRNADIIGYSSHFTIYDSDDQKRVMKSIIKNNGIDEKMFPVKAVLNIISNAKDDLISVSEYEQTAGSDLRLKTIAKLYRLYQNELKKNDAMDFDDMIYNTVELLKTDADTLDYYQNRFKYLMVDEYQDTNHAQYVLVSMLAGKNKNICVVGDDDQSIYRFRGATIENILGFENEFKNAKVIRLEQNYRSTGNILNAANEVIRNNVGRKGKNLWTDSGNGEKIEVFTAFDERDEAKFVAEKILEDVKNGGKFSENAVLYRMNAQSASIENAFARSGIAYTVIGGHRFYDREEIKDVLAYLQVINNKNDSLRLKRIINKPARGIGATTVNNASEISENLGIPLYSVLQNAADYPLIGRAAAKLDAFCKMLNGFMEFAEDHTVSEIFDEMLEKTGYLDMLLTDSDPKSADRAENVKQLGSEIKSYELDSDEPSLSAFLEETALINDVDAMDDEVDKSVMMTIHSAKGLEFKNVYLVGMEEGIFPGSQTLYGGPEEMEEERRLAYVAITRAKEKLFITNASTRMLYGSTTRNFPSRFLNEIPPEYCNQTARIGFSQSAYSSEGHSVPRTSSRRIHTDPFAKTTVAPVSAAADYKEGQVVEHKTFGKGMIIKVTKMSNDTLLEIAFENVGTKKIMANYTKLKSV